MQAAPSPARVGKHPALSNLGLLLLAPPGEEAAHAIRAVTGWTPAMQSAIRRRLLGGTGTGDGTVEASRIAPQLRVFAGHAEADTTHVSYLHLNDLALGLHLQALREERPVTEATRMLGANLARGSCPDAPVSLEALRGEGYGGSEDDDPASAQS